MRNRISLTTVLIVRLFAVGFVCTPLAVTHGQSNPGTGQLAVSQEPCPVISVSCPAEVGASIPFTASVISSNPRIVPTYSWTVSSGTITHGQGTVAIQVSSPRNGEPVTGTVSIGGFDKRCASTASCTTAIVDASPLAVLFDRYYPKSFVFAARKKLPARRRVHRGH